MDVTVPPRYEALIREKVEQGDYLDASAVIEEALRLLEERDRLRRLRQLIDEGDADIARGDVVAWTPQLHEEVMQRAIEDAKAGKQPAPHVVP
jgi:antitoxin ParD1/3/4